MPIQRNALQLSKGMRKLSVDSVNAFWDFLSREKKVKCKRESAVCYPLCKTEREISKYSQICLFLQKETQEEKSRN